MMNEPLMSEPFDLPIMMMLLLWGSVRLLRDLFMGERFIDFRLSLPKRVSVRIGAIWMDSPLNFLRDI